MMAVQETDAEYCRFRRGHPALNEDSRDIYDGQQRWATASSGYHADELVKLLNEAARLRAREPVE
jgi:hypothetical protein